MLGTESHYTILESIQFVHLDDLCESHIFLFERPEAKGRYICSSHDINIYDLAKMLKNRYPEYNIPQKLVLFNIFFMILIVLLALLIPTNQRSQSPFPVSCTYRIPAWFKSSKLIVLLLCIILKEN